MIKLDKKDHRILSELDMNARISLTQLAKKVGLSRQAVEYRIKKMEENQVIFKSLTILDSVVVGGNWYRTILRLLNISKSEKDKFIEYLKTHPDTLWVGEVGGNWDLAINFVCKDNFEFNKVFEKMTEKFGSYIRDYEILIYIDVYDLQRQFILDKKDSRKTLYHKMKFDTQFKLDKLDKQIIKMIKLNSLFNLAEIASELKVSPNTIKNRIKIMNEKVLILGYRTFINPFFFGYKSHMLFLEITRLNLKREQELYEYLKTIPNITFLVKHIGRWRIGMEIETKSEEDFHEIFVEIRGKFNDIITNFESFPLFRDHKIDYFPDGSLK